MSNLKISRESIIYILCPANVATGGPELLHQLANKLISIGFNALMYYLPTDVESPTPPQYEHYNVPFCREVINDDQNMIIFPESHPIGIYDLRFSRLQKVLWWLSVDNYFSSLKLLEKVHNHKKLYKIKQFFLNYYKIPSLKYLAKDRSLLHFAQSYFALNFLKRNNIHRVSYLSDYLGKDFLSKAGETNNVRKNIVLYNPKKGFEFTNKIIAKTPELDWKPIENLKPDQVSELLSESKVYIDFGNHPGKDRFPREAAIMGCCVITGKRGSAAYTNDVSIDEEFKFDDKEIFVDKIIEKIKSCLSNFETETQKFKHYRATIIAEEKTFMHDLKKIFTVK